MRASAINPLSGDVAEGVLRLSATPQATSRPRAGADTEVSRWLESQAVNAERAALLIRPFSAGEFGTGAASPAAAHLSAVNTLITRLQQLVQRHAQQQRASSNTAIRSPAKSALENATRTKDQGTLLITQIERVWQFYWEIFGQRQTVLADRLLAADRIALDCYQYSYGGLGTARSIPSPAPFAYMEAGQGPATFRRFVPIGRLSQLPNPFPLVKLPYHRLVTPWTLGAIPHEVAHNLQSDLGLWLAVPRRIYPILRRAGLSPETAKTWVRWHKEIFADLLGLLLIGPAFINSLMDVVGRSAELTFSFNPRAVHPTPWLRVFINLELLTHIGFRKEAESYRLAWLKLYPGTHAARLPQELRATFPKASQLTVAAMALHPWAQLGGKALTEVVAFRPQDQEVALEAAHRLALGRDPGIIPERFLIPATRLALDHKLASPATISRHFYEALGRR